VSISDHGTRRPSGRRRPWAWVLAAAGVAAVAVHSSRAAGDMRTAFAHPGGLRLCWLAVAAAAEVVSLACGAAGQRQLLAAGDVRLPWRTLFFLVLASTGLAKVMPAGPVTAAAWQAAQYRRRGTGAAIGVWAVAAGGFASTVVILGLLLAGAAMAGVVPLWLLGGAAGLLAAGIAGLTAAPRRASALGRLLSRRGDGSRVIARLAEAAAGLSGQRAGFRLGAGVLACAAVGFMADACALASCFALTGLPVPWRSLVFAYAAGQLAGRLVPLPAGLGAVEGGVLGGLMLTGTPPVTAAAAVIAYRVAGYWAVGAAGTAAAAALTRNSPRRGSAAPSARAAEANAQMIPHGSLLEIGATHNPGLLEISPASRVGPSASTPVEHMGSSEENRGSAVSPRQPDGGWTAAAACHAVTLPATVTQSGPYPDRLGGDTAQANGKSERSSR
jgi:uncharacterized membrane protein YbhN (UPF0104 family)